MESVLNFRLTEQDRRMLRGMRVAVEEEAVPEPPQVPRCNPAILLVAFVSGMFVVGGLLVIGTGISLLDASR